MPFVRVLEIVMLTLFEVAWFNAYIPLRANKLLRKNSNILVDLNRLHQKCICKQVATQIKKLRQQ